jgi:hypothetical protein
MTSIILFLFSALAAPADTWQGTWALDVPHSDFGSNPRLDSATTVITRADDRLVMTRSAWMGAAHGMLKYDQATDGASDFASTSRGDAISSRVSWEDGALVIEGEIQSNLGPGPTMDRMSLADDDTLVLERWMDVPGFGESEQTWVYRRR